MRLAPCQSDFRYRAAMSTPDFNLLPTLDVLLQEGSVAGAARRLRLSPYAMSRTLARLREATGDPLLVRAGRGLVPTPRAQALRDSVRLLVQQGTEVLRPTETLDLAQLARTFTLRTREGFVENFGAALIARVAAEAPGVRLCFEPKTGQDNSALRDDLADLETGVVGKATAPELRAQALLRDRWVAVVRAGHPLAQGPLDTPAYVAARHIGITHHRRGPEPVDAALQALGLQRALATTVGGFATALSLARATDLVATVPERHTHTLRVGLHTMPLPVPTPVLTISLLWHPRHDADPAHRWLRGCVREVCAAPT